MAKYDLMKNIAQMNYGQLTKILPDPDKVLQKAGKSIDAYRDLLIDEHLYSVRQQREMKLQAMLWELYQEGTPDNIYELVNDSLQRVKIYNLIRDILDARFLGTAVIEIMWEQRNGFWVPASFELKPLEWFKLKPDLTWRMFLPSVSGQPTNGDGEELPPYKFLIVQNSPTPLDPYGEKILKRCFWPVTLKRGGLKFWARFTEKYGMPQLFGKLAPGTPKEKIDALLNALQMMFEDAVAVGPSDGSIEAINAGNTSNSENYREYLQYLENSISKAVLTQTLTTQLGDSGSYGATKSHADTLEDLAKADAQFVSEAIDTLIRYIVELNFSAVPKDLPKFVMYFEDETDKVLAERDKILSEIGVKFNSKYIERVYNIPEDEFTIEGAITPAPAQFAEPEPVTDPVDALTGAVIEKAVAEINTFSSFQEMLDNLDRVFVRMDTGKIREALAKESFAAKVKGYEDVG